MKKKQFWRQKLLLFGTIQSHITQFPIAPKLYIYYTYMNNINKIKNRTVIRKGRYKTKHIMQNESFGNTKRKNLNTLYTQSNLILIYEFVFFIFFYFLSIFFCFEKRYREKHSKIQTDNLNHI